MDFSIRTGAEDLNEALLIRPSSSHCSAEALGIIEGAWLHQSQDQTFQVATQLRLELFDQILQNFQPSTIRYFILDNSYPILRFGFLNLISITKTMTMTRLE